MIQPAVVAMITSGAIVGIVTWIGWRATSRIHARIDRFGLRLLVAPVLLGLWSAIGLAILSPREEEDVGTWRCLVCADEREEAWYGGLLGGRAHAAGEARRYDGKLARWMKHLGWPGCATSPGGTMDQSGSVGGGVRYLAHRLFDEFEATSGDVDRMLGRSHLGRLVRGFLLLLMSMIGGYLFALEYIFVGRVAQAVLAGAGGNPFSETFAVVTNDPLVQIVGSLVAGVSGVLAFALAYCLVRNTQLLKTIPVVFLSVGLEIAVLTFLGAAYSAAGLGLIASYPTLVASLTYCRKRYPTSY